MARPSSPPRDCVIKMINGIDNIPANAQTLTHFLSVDRKRSSDIANGISDSAAKSLGLENAKFQA